MMLKEYLRRKRLTITAFADQLSTSKGYVSDIIAGKRSCSLEMAVAIEDLTGGRVKCRDLLLPEKQGRRSCPTT